MPKADENPQQAGGGPVRQKRDVARQTERIEEPAPFIKETKTTGEHVGAIALLAFGAVPIVVGWLAFWFGDGTTEDPLRRFLAFSVIGIFGFAVIETFSVILLWGMGRLELPAPFVKWLGMATIGEVAGMSIAIIQAVFG